MIIEQNYQQCQKIEILELEKIQSFKAVESLLACVTTCWLQSKQVDALEVGELANLTGFYVGLQNQRIANSRFVSDLRGGMVVFEVEKVNPSFLNLSLDPILKSFLFSDQVSSVNISAHSSRSHFGKKELSMIGNHH